jgi:hypothetical protein
MLLKPLEASPFDVRSVKLPITKVDILEAIRESRARFWLAQLPPTRDRRRRRSAATRIGTETAPLGAIPRAENT